MCWELWHFSAEIGSHFDFFLQVNRNATLVNCWCIHVYSPTWIFNFSKRILYSTLFFHEKEAKKLPQSLKSLKMLEHFIQTQRLQSPKAKNIWRIIWNRWCQQFSAWYFYSSSLFKSVILQTCFTSCPTCFHYFSDKSKQKKGYSMYLKILCWDIMWVAYKSTSTQMYIIGF